MTPIRQRIDAPGWIMCQAGFTPFLRVTPDPCPGPKATEDTRCVLGRVDEVRLSFALVRSAVDRQVRPLLLGGDLKPGVRERLGGGQASGNPL